MTGIGSAKRALSAALGELEAAVEALRQTAGGGERTAALQAALEAAEAARADLAARLAAAEAERDAARDEVEAMRRARAEDAELIEAALGELRAVAAAG